MFQRTPAICPKQTYVLFECPSLHIIREHEGFFEYESRKSGYKEDLYSDFWRGAQPVTELKIRLNAAVHVRDKYWDLLGITWRKQY